MRGRTLWTSNGWTAVGTLLIGEQVWTLEGWAEVIWLEETGERETVYNFEVDGLHTYFVGESGVWAHNACRTPGTGAPRGKPGTYRPNWTLPRDKHGRPVVSRYSVDVKSTPVSPRAAALVDGRP